MQPPDYTGRPSLYLNEVDRPTLQLPEGSLVTVRFYGQPGVMSVVESVSDRTDPDPTTMAQDFTIEASGRLSVRGPGGARLGNHLDDRYSAPCHAGRCARARTRRAYAAGLRSNR